MARRPLPLLSLLLALAALAAASDAARAQSARVTTTVDRVRVEIGEDIELTIQADGRYEELELPSTDGFDVVGQRFTQVNRRISRSYVLRSRGAGSFTIGPARLKLGGRVVAESEPITVTVTEPAAAAPVDAAVAQDLAALEKESVFVRWHSGRTRYVVGEPFTLTLELWMQHGLASRQAELIKAAALEGLLVEELPRDEGRETKKRVIGRTAFNVHPLTIVIATPLEAGRVLVDATTVRLAIAEDEWAIAARTVTRSTQPFWLDIDAVPVEGRPTGFKDGQIGNFDLKVSLKDDRGLAPRQARTGQRLVLRAEISGRGNVSGLAEPEVAHDGSWEISRLPGTQEDRVTRDASGVRGTRVFQWLVVPQQPGPRPPPTVRLDWYDPEAGRYERASSALPDLEVTGAPQGSEALDATQLGEDVGPLVTTAPLDAKRRAPLIASPVYLAALGLFALLFLVVEVRHRRAAREARAPGARASRLAQAAARKRLKAAERAVREGLGRDAHALVARALTAYLEERVNIPAAGLTHDQLREAMVRAGFERPLIEQLVAELEHCEYARFAPGEKDAQRLRDTFARASTIIDRLDAAPVRRLP